MASKGINVKIARTALIDELNRVLLTMKNTKDSYEVELADYEKNVDEWKLALLDIARQKGKAKAKDISTRYSWEKGCTTIDVTFAIPEKLISSEPERPENPYKSSGYGRNYVGGYEDRVAEITNAIRILELSEDEYVSASTYGAVSKYL